MKITEYTTVAAGTLEALDEQVQNAISRGWQPIGGVSSAFQPSTNTLAKVGFVQAMVKYDQ